MAGFYLNNLFEVQSGDGIHVSRFSRGSKLRTLSVISMALLVLAAGCGGPKPGAEIDLTAVTEEESDVRTETPPPEVVTSPVAETQVAERPAYKLGIGDRLWIKFFYYPGYSLEVMVRPDGVVTIPSLGEVKAEGMTPKELEDMIRTHYAQILAEPTVSVIVLRSASEQIFVFGEVNRPGAIDYSSSLTLLEAVAGAGGVTTEAKQNNLVLIRKTAGGEFQGTKLNLEDILDNPATNVALLPRDVIYVPMSSIAKVDLFVSQFFQQISPVLYFYIAGGEIFDPEGRFFIGR